MTNPKLLDFDSSVKYETPIFDQIAASIRGTDVSRLIQDLQQDPTPQAIANVSAALMNYSLAWSTWDMRLHEMEIQHTKDEEYIEHLKGEVEQLRKPWPFR